MSFLGLFLLSPRATARDQTDGSLLVFLVTTSREAVLSTLTPVKDDHFRPFSPVFFRTHWLTLSSGTVGSESRSGSWEERVVSGDLLPVPFH